MKSKATQNFWKLYDKLPNEIQEKTKDVYEKFKDDPWYSSLNFKKVHSTQPIYSVRITRDYRALGVLKASTIIWFWIGSHSDYNNLLSQM